MKTLSWRVALSLVAWLVLAGPAAAQDAASAATPGKAYSQQDAQKRAEAYSAFTMGHLYEEYYEATSRSEYANQAIEFYKKAYELDPGSAVIRERLAEIYFKSQRIRNASATR